jgi:hypothetical protein
MLAILQHPKPARSAGRALCFCERSSDAPATKKTTLPPQNFQRFTALLVEGGNALQNRKEKTTMNNQATITVKTRVTGGALLSNHNESVAVKTRLTSGSFSWGRN